MNEKEDIKKQLKLKNKEIYLKKLNLDLDNNLEVLVLTIDNLLNTIKTSLVKKIINIEESFQNHQDIQTDVDNFLELYREQILTLLDDKKSFVQNIIVIEDNLVNYKNNLEDNYLIFKEKIETFSNDKIKILTSSLTKDIEDKFTIKRLSDFLTNIFLLNLNNKILDCVKSRDVILMNTFNETYLKYLELNKNTIGV